MGNSQKEEGYPQLLGLRDRSWGHEDLDIRVGRANFLSGGPVTPIKSPGSVVQCANSDLTSSSDLCFRNKLFPVSRVARQPLHDSIGFGCENTMDGKWYTDRFPAVAPEEATLSLSVPNRYTASALGEVVMRMGFVSEEPVKDVLAVRGAVPRLHQLSVAGGSNREGSIAEMTELLRLGWQEDM